MVLFLRGESHRPASFLVSRLNTLHSGQGGSMFKILSKTAIEMDFSYPSLRSTDVAKRMIRELEPLQLWQS